MTDFPVTVFAFPGQTGGDDDFAVLYRAGRMFRDEIDACATALGPGRVLAAIIEGDVVSVGGHPDGPAAGMAAVLAS